EIGTKIEEREVWKNIEEYEFIEGERVTIRAYTNVEWGDHVEWIPTYFGVRVPEWADWSNLQVDYGYYQMFNTTGAHNFTVPNGVSSVAVLVVGGGGSGGLSPFSFSSGGGGGGSVIFNTSYPTTPNTNISLFV